MMNRTGSTCAKPKCRKLDSAEGMISCRQCSRSWHHSCARYKPSSGISEEEWVCLKFDCVSRTSLSPEEADALSAKQGGLQSEASDETEARESEEVNAPEGALGGERKVDDQPDFLGFDSLYDDEARALETQNLKDIFPITKPDGRSEEDDDKVSAEEFKTVVEVAEEAQRTASQALKDLDAERQEKELVMTALEEQMAAFEEERAKFELEREELLKRAAAKVEPKVTMPEVKTIRQPSEKVASLLARAKAVKESSKVMSAPPPLSTSTPINHESRSSQASGISSLSLVATPVQAKRLDLVTLMSRQHIQELPSFAGDNIREWPYFEEVFRSTTIEGDFNGKENVGRLRKALTGEAYQLVSDLLKYSSDADAIMDSLREIFGRSDILVHELTAGLMALPKIQSKSDPKLRQWAVMVKGFVADIKTMKRDGDLSSEYVLTSLASKLDGSLYGNWQILKRSKPSANIEDFAKFLSEKVAEMKPNLEALSSHTGQKQSSPSRSNRRVMTHNQNSPNVAENSTGSCLKCGKPSHPMGICTEFKKMTTAQRSEYARANRLCFVCLDPRRHEFKTCSPNMICNTNGCQLRHHPLLHRIKRRM